MNESFMTSGEVNESFMASATGSGNRRAGRNPARIPITGT